MSTEESHAIPFLFYIILLIAILVVALLFLPQIIALGEKARTQISPTTKEKEQTVEGRYKSLGIVSTDSPLDKLYKLFRNFDTAFFNETTDDNNILYNSFILDLPTRTSGPPSYTANEIHTAILDGIEEFDSTNNLYKVGTSLSCPRLIGFGTDYDNDCWSGIMDSILTNNLNDANPCRIYESESLGSDGVSGLFTGKLKIRVGWKQTARAPDGRQMISIIVTFCDD